LYDLAKDRCDNVPQGYLSKRVQREHLKKSVPEKYASDVYLLYGFVNGSVSLDVLQKEVLSKHKQRGTNSCSNGINDEEELLPSSKVKDGLDSC
jgi:hypothetical protein